MNFLKKTVNGKLVSLHLNGKLPEKKEDFWELGYTDTINFLKSCSNINEINAFRFDTRKPIIDLVKKRKKALE